jgi:hypothetical protein
VDTDAGEEGGVDEGDHVETDAGDLLTLARDVLNFEREKKKKKQKRGEEKNQHFAHHRKKS